MQPMSLRQLLISLLLIFVLMYVASLASTLSGAVIYNVFWAGPETFTVACEHEQQPPPKLNW